MNGPLAEPGGPERLRQAMAEFVTEIHRTYRDEMRSMPPAIQGRLPLICGVPFHVAAVGVRNLHVVATTEPLGAPGDGQVEVRGSVPPIEWTLRFYDVTVLPALGRLDESENPAVTGVRRALGISTWIYHLMVEPGSSLDGHRAMHVGTGLANSHAGAAQDFGTMRRLAAGREELVDEMEAATTAGLRRAPAMLASALAPDDERVAELARGPRPDPEQLRRAVLSALRHRHLDRDESHRTDDRQETRRCQPRLT